MNEADVRRAVLDRGIDGFGRLEPADFDEREHGDLYFGRSHRAKSRCPSTLRCPGCLDFARHERNGKLVLKRSEEHTSELQSLMRISYAVFCLIKKTKITNMYFDLLSIQ